MRKPTQLDIESYNYHLPSEKIAQYPLEKRDTARLLYFNKGETASNHFYNLPELLDKEHHLIFNDTKVIQARILFQKESGAEIEIFLLEPYSPGDYPKAFEETKETIWKCLIGNARKWKSGILEKTIINETLTTNLRAEQTEADNCKLVRFTWENSDICFSQIILSAGLIPLPPYLGRKAELSDKIRYQTIYSDFEGSVAAPTAGLHFTDDVFRELINKGITKTFLTLHVGAGTFIPVQGDDAISHNMHTEHFIVSKESLNELIKKNNKLIPVGTTSLRTIESLYWIGIKLTQSMENNEDIYLDQWEAYTLEKELSRKDALMNILNYLKKNKLDHLKASTRIMIVPGYDFKMTDGIITNFHQPKSTLLLLIAAFIGDSWRDIYEYALKNDYRFLSYGDGSLIIK